ncbi:serine/threonine-protein kinase-like protein At1g28390 [Ziziphus jujuba]|uniref:Serine/threonine-protein kinase-like protein At1g28390 n=1 Tax=Ziziphus jujuba TaxID=326968 RepID=A0ABM3IP81_ZIZJJ|nr:serine/threonine-protein kinase-like protein At1g28390 [Ziziphus jujuba]
MGYLSCNAESAIATCDPHNWDLKRKPKSARHKLNKPVEIRDFSYDELVAATNGFSAESFLGKGSHGSVYKALLDNGKFIAAVKKTKISNSTATFHNHRRNCTNCTSCTSPAENEIEILSRVRNPRFVNLIGFCAADHSNNTKLIVVEYMPNGSLYDLLHSSSSSRSPGWTRRVRFGLQVAKAVQALHSSNPPVIHRDIKSSNILIDQDWCARLGDFGLALRGHVEDVRVKCTPPAGTLGYLDPGYLAPGDLSAKSDVFSFGILLLEIISGRNAIDMNYSPPSVVDWAVPMIKRGDYAGICDRRIGAPADPAVIRQLAVLAARCVRSTAEKRPAMAEVVECLKIVWKRVHAPPFWNNLRRRVSCVDESKPLISNQEVYDGSEDVVKVTRVGSRRNRKVSSVSSAEYGSVDIGLGYGNDRMGRSKSIGSSDEIKVSGRKAGVTVKMAAVKLSKSRSMGVLHSQRFVHYNKRGGFVFEFGREVDSELAECDMSKLVIRLDEKSEKEMLVKPLVSI